MPETAAEDRLVPVLVELTIRERPQPTSQSLVEEFATMSDGAGREVTIMRTLNGMRFVIFGPSGSGLRDLTVDIQPVLDAFASHLFDTVPAERQP